MHSAKTMRRLRMLRMREMNAANERQREEFKKQASKEEKQPTRARDEL